MIIVDGFSKWVEVLPLKDRASKTVAKIFLNEVISHYGAPVVVIFDKGNEFWGEFDNLLWRIGSKHYEATPGHP